MTIGVSLCFKCSRFRPGTSGEDDGIDVGTCDAFPEGIPVDIFAGGFDHRKPFAEESLLFEPSPGVKSEDVDAVLEFASFLADDE